MELLEEIVSVVPRPKLKKFFSEESVQDIFTLIDTYGIIIPVETSVIDFSGLSFGLALKSIMNDGL